MLLEMVGALADDGVERDVEVWLPTDLVHPPPELSLCTALEARGVAVRHLDLPILRRAYTNPRGLSTLFLRAARLTRRLRRARPDMVYCTTSAAMLGAPAARFAGVPRIIGHVQEIWSRSDAVVLGRAARCCDAMLSISSAVAEALPEALRTRTRVVPNAVPEPPTTPPPAGTRRRLTFLVASRWNAWKGHHTLLRAWDEAGSPGELIVLGGPPRSGEQVDVAALVATLEQPGTVRVVGEVEDPSDYLAEADVMIVPSDDPEPFGLVVIESFARGRPVIASEAGGPLEIVTPGKDGWLFRPRDAAALGAVLAGLTPDEVSLAGREARRTYEHRYTSWRFQSEWRAQVLEARATQVVGTGRTA